MRYDTPSFKEDHISQVPALQLLQNLGYKYLAPAAAVELRGGRMGAVILESVLADQLRKIVAQSTARSAVYDVLTNGVQVQIVVNA